MRKTALVLGTNAGQADLIRYLKTAGWRVVGCSPIVGEVGQQFCDAVEHVNIVDLDALEAVARKHSVDIIYSISSDVAIKSVVALSERMGLPHFFDSAFIDLLDNKAALRAFLTQHDLSPVPFRHVATVQDAAGWSAFPCVVKPVDGQGQRGVVKVSNPVELADAVNQALEISRSKKAIVEAYLDGVEVSCNVLICDGKTQLKVLSERLVHKGLALGLPAGHLIPPVHVSARHQEEALALVDAIIAKMQIKAGVLYFQMIITEGGPRVVEIAPRLDGCHMWRLIKASYGADLVQMTVDCLTGKSVGKVAPEYSGPNMELMFQQMPPGGNFDRMKFPKPDNFAYHEYRYKDGEAVRAVNGTLEVVGYYVRESA
ncbi:ATP-grasp domain-containing protein [Rhizobium herbae]|uniref:Biotin carboxylase n=1 Tax=Rhizobium herbae TaxID=508661 RepID=A0ABS4EIL6_9HYPH|nr:ATP-grasp domain-containing protein [Rhizobium herbae]MBP1857794.1 biotin carboxylase [Rhizobium herbae]